MYQTIEECLKIKSTAHIFIDQMPPLGWPRGLGRSGLEGMAVGAVTLSDIYPAENLKRYFKMPPVVRISNQDVLHKELKSLLTHDGRRKKLQAESRDWITANVELKPWLEYVEKWL